MLMESSFSSSVESSLLKVSEYRDPFDAYDWSSLAETYEMIQKIPKRSQHPKIQLSCPKQSAMHKVSKKSLTSLVYSRRKGNRRPVGTVEHNPRKTEKQDDSLDDSIVPVHNPGESTKRKNRFNNCFVYSRKRRREKSSCNFIGETAIRGDDGLDNAFVSKNDFGETSKTRVTRFDNCLVYRRKKGRVKFNSCSLTKLVSGGACISIDQTDSNDSFSERHIGETKRNGARSDGLLMYRRRKQRGKSIGARVNGFLVYSRKKRKVKHSGTFTGHDPRDDTQVTEVKCSSDGTNSSTLKSSKNGEDEARDCDSSAAEASETDTDNSMSPFRQCKHCDKPGTGEKMLICDECEEAYHTSCCGVRMKEVTEIDDWLCPSCLKNNSSKTKIKGRTSRERKWRVTQPFVAKILIGKEFQADVPDWSGPTMSDISFVGEPLEIDESEYLHDLKKAKAKNGKKPHSAVNWLQCREEDSNGDICGKWRRAPRSEVQTKDWECFCCVFWDPSHADCAVPQELETSEILKQLKYIKMLRPRSDAKTRKLGPKGRNRSHNKGKSS